MTTHQNVGEIIPTIFKENRHLINAHNLNRTIDEFLPERTILNSLLRSLYTFQVVLKMIQHFCVNHF
jgi:hypothetical protein